MKIQASQILAEFKQRNILDSMTGGDVLITGIAPVEYCGPGDMVFVEKAELVGTVIAAKPAAVVTSSELAELFNDLAGSAVLISSNVRLAQALLRQAYVDRDMYNTEWPRIHPTAVIHESVKVPADAVIGPGAVLGRKVQIGKRAVVMANTVIEENAHIGEESVIHPNVVIGYNCKIGNRCIIKSGCVIGMEGFGFAQDEKRKSYRIPQLGKVVIEDDVVLGANNTIDRATYDETLIRSGVKTDTLCHIAHNTEIDEDVIIVAQTGIAGSCYIGKRVLISGQAAISDHVKIADDVVLVQRAGVISDIDKPGMYAGHPLQPVRQYFKNSALLTKLTDMKKQINKLEKTLQNTDEQAK
ncbi:MAG: UDP-3-O-(3-hydroxymyristoyl)glucosamine N-acyltransferase [Gammaproteobacteria bacterium]|nr:UDP-3-O-(3-hydroxymyristoyl)glucosamine N-acyltransferase [Gammaproteobacteria bacterium]